MSKEISKEEAVKIISEATGIKEEKAEKAYESLKEYIFLFDEETINKFFTRMLKKDLGLDNY